MTDDSSHGGETQRTHVVAGERHELERFASRHGISTAEARELFERLGHDRDALEREVLKLRHP
jgi:hypothetical protein